MYNEVKTINVSNVKKIKVIKEIPIAKRINTVKVGFILIFLKE
jgi:hypothetical protein|tara:strand:- start:4 stop:132 length:129 start_codon:yes stop_codon:yes gene_type:complete